MQEFEIDGQAGSPLQVKNAWILSVMVNGFHTNAAVIRDGKVSRHLPVGHLETMTYYAVERVESFFLDENANITQQNAAAKQRPHRNYLSTYIDFVNLLKHKDYSEQVIIQIILAIAGNLPGKKGFVFCDIENKRIKFMPLDYNFATASHDGNTFLLTKYDEKNKKTQLLILDNPLLD